MPPNKKSEPVFVLGAKNATRGMSVSKHIVKPQLLLLSQWKQNGKFHFFKRVRWVPPPNKKSEPVFVLGAKNVTRGMSVSKTNSEIITFAPKPMKTRWKIHVFMPDSVSSNLEKSQKSPNWKITISQNNEKTRKSPILEKVIGFVLGVKKRYAGHVGVKNP